MKKIVLIGVVALAVANAMAWGRDADDPKKILERYRESVRSEIRAEAYRQATDETEKKFGIVYVNWSNGVGETKWTNNCERPILLQTYGTLCKYGKGGRLIKAGYVEDFEEWRWREARQREIQEALWQDQSVTRTVVSNIFARENARKARDSAQESQSRVGSLEKLIPFEEAMELAKDGKGKGYFQLALRYANGEELPCEPRTAYKMLRKAADVNYANAVLVEGLCDEVNLRAEVGGDYCYGRRRGRSVSFKDDGSSVREALREYCGHNVRFDTGRHSQMTDSLTNEVAFAYVMAKYEKAKTLGALTATNQIAALNKRLADFNKALADYAKALADYAEKVAAEERKRAQQRLEYDKRSAIWAANNRKVNAVFGAKELAQYRAVFKEMFGYEMGETIAQETGDSTEIDRRGKCWRVRKLRTPYRDFTSMRLYCVDDRLCTVTIELESEDKGTSDPLEQEAIAVVKDFGQRYGIKFGRRDSRDCLHWGGGRWGWSFSVEVSKGKMSVRISDYDLKDELEKAAKSRKE